MPSPAPPVPRNLRSFEAGSRSQLPCQPFSRSCIEVRDPQGGTAGSRGDLGQERGEAHAPLEGSTHYLTRLEPASRRYGRLTAQAPVTHDQPVLLESPTRIPVRKPSVQGGGWHQEERQKAQDGPEDQEPGNRGGESEDQVPGHGPEDVAPEGTTREWSQGGIHGELGSSCGQELLYLLVRQEGKQHGRDTGVLAVAGALHAHGGEAERLAQHTFGDPDGLYAGEGYGRLAAFEKAAFDVKEVSLARERESGVGQNRSCYRQKPGQEQARGDKDQEHHKPVRCEGLDEAPDESIREEVVEKLRPDSDNREGHPDLAARGPGHQQVPRREPSENCWARGHFRSRFAGTFELAPQRLCRRQVQRGERCIGFARAPARGLDAHLDHAEEALNDPLHCVHRLDVIQGYRPLASLEHAMTQTE